MRVVFFHSIQIFKSFATIVMTKIDNFLRLTNHFMSLKIKLFDSKSLIKMSLFNSKKSINNNINAYSLKKSEPSKPEKNCLLRKQSFVIDYFDLDCCLDLDRCPSMILVNYISWISSIWDVKWNIDLDFRNDIDHNQVHRILINLWNAASHNLCKQKNRNDDFYTLHVFHETCFFFLFFCCFFRTLINAILFFFAAIFNKCIFINFFFKSFKVKQFNWIFRVQIWHWTEYTFLKTINNCDIWNFWDNFICIFFIQRCM